VIELMEALHQAGVPTRLDSVRRIVVFVVNSVSAPRTVGMNRTASGRRAPARPGLGRADRPLLVRGDGTAEGQGARWQSLRRLRQAAAFAGDTDPAIAGELKAQTSRSLPSTFPLRR